MSDTREAALRRAAEAIAHDVWNGIGVALGIPYMEQILRRELGDVLRDAEMFRRHCAMQPQSFEEHIARMTDERDAAMGAEVRDAR